MNLLDQEQQIKKQEPKGKKIVLFLLILSIFAVIMIIVMMMALSGKETKKLAISVNGTNIAIDEGLLITDENGVNYISIHKISKAIGYNYLTGEYKQYNEDTTNTKCYLENTNQVIQFEANSKKIYKIYPTSDLDYEEYELANKILKQNNLLYVALDDVNIALNVVYSQNDNAIALKTVETLNEEYKTSLPKQTNNALVGVSDSFNNKKTIAYNMLVVSNESGKWGVISTKDFSTIIGNKYSSIEFIESANAFIVSDNNKYGVITDEKLIIDLNYEEIKVINNNPLCYEVKAGENHAIVNSMGKIITNKVYNSIGYISRNALEESVIVIKNLGKNKINALVVCKDDKYGLLNLDDGTSIGDCVLDKVYSKTENGEKVYYIQLKEQEVLLSKYLEHINTTTVNLGQ